MAEQNHNKPLWIKHPLAVLADGAGAGLVVADDKIVELVTRVLQSSAYKPLFAWLESFYPIWAGLTPEAVTVASELALAELLLSGVTCAADHHYVFPAGLEHAVDCQVEAARRIGVRVVLTRGSMSLSTKDGGLPPASVVQSDDVILRDSVRVIEAFHEPGEGAMVQIALAPCSPFSVSRELLVQTAGLARKHGVRLHTHLAETEDETAFCLEHFGLRPVDYLANIGWLGPEVWLAHGIYFDPEEMARLGAAGCGVCHCPSSNMVLASGTCRVCALEGAGVAVGLGVDGSASNDGSNMIAEVRQAFLLQRAQYGADKVSPMDALRWATAGSAHCLGRGDIGAIRPGAQADLALFKLDGPQFSGAQLPLDALVLCGADRAHDVMVAGRWRAKDRQLIDIDLDELMARHAREARALWGRAA
jgi:8-oxoguanine deaminase